MKMESNFANNGDFNIYEFREQLSNIKLEDVFTLTIDDQVKSLVYEEAEQHSLLIGATLRTDESQWPNVQFYFEDTSEIGKDKEALRDAIAVAVTGFLIKHGVKDLKIEAGYRTIQTGDIQHRTFPSFDVDITYKL